MSIDSAIPLPGICTKELHEQVCKKISTRIFTAAKNWKESKSPLIGDCLIIIMLRSYSYMLCNC